MGTDSDKVASVSGDMSLRHVLLVGGTLADWAALGTAEWQERVQQLGAWGDQHGVRWLTIRPYETGHTPPMQHAQRWSYEVGQSTVAVDPSADGRQRFADAMSGLEPAEQVNEATVASVLYEPADCEPDLVVVLGPSTRLPPSLIWELAYAELVFVDTGWDALGVGDLSGALADFTSRRRRFGGLGTDEA